MADISLLDGPYTATEVTDTNPLTIPITVSSGAKALVVLVTVDSSADINPVASYNGVSMGAAIAEVLGAGDAQPAAIFVIANPTTGSHDVTVSRDISTQDHLAVTVYTLQGDVDTATLTSSPVTANGATIAALSVNVTSAAKDFVVDVISINESISNLAPDAGQTEQSDHNAGGVGGTHQGTSTEPGASTVAMGWTWTSNSSRVGLAAVNIKSTAAPAAVRFNNSGTRPRPFAPGLAR